MSLHIGPDWSNHTSPALSTTPCTTTWCQITALVFTPQAGTKLYEARDRSSRPDLNALCEWAPLRSVEARAVEFCASIELTQHAGLATDVGLRSPRERSPPPRTLSGICRQRRIVHLKSITDKVSSTTLKSRPKPCHCDPPLEPTCRLEETTRRPRVAVSRDLDCS